MEEATGQSVQRLAWLRPETSEGKGRLLLAWRLLDDQFPALASDQFVQYLGSEPASCPVQLAVFDIFLVGFSGWVSEFNPQVLHFLQGIDPKTKTYGARYVECMQRSYSRFFPHLCASEGMKLEKTCYVHLSMGHHLRSGLTAIGSDL